MTQEEILGNLCYYDKRNPYHYWTDPDEDFENHLDDRCHCDNCFYGRTQLAEYILTLQDHGRQDN